MKRLLLGAITALAFLFGFASCSGDLHDEPMPVREPVTIEGASWYFVDIAVWGDSDGSQEGLIVNNNNKGLQTDNTKLPTFKAANGGVFYYTYNGVNNGYLNDSYQEDNPSFKPEPGKIRIYVYTAIDEPCLHHWGDLCSETAWPGTRMIKVGEVAKTEVTKTMTIKTVKVTDLPDSFNGKEVSFVGGFNNFGNPSEYKKIIKDNTFEYTFDPALEISVKGIVDEPTTTDIKIASTDWKQQICSLSGDNEKIAVIDGAKNITITGVAVKTDVNDWGTPDDLSDDGLNALTLFSISYN